MKKIFVIISIVWWFYLLSDRDSSVHIYWIILLCVGLYLTFSNHLFQIYKKIAEGRSYSTKKDDTNCNFSIHIKLEKILNHSLLKKYFSSDCFEKNNTLLADIKKNASKLIKDEKIHEDVKINIKGGNIYKNGELVFEDNFYHDVSIPFDLETFEEKDYRQSYWVIIRILLINGILKLQVWNFEPWEMNIISTENIAWEYHTYRSFYDLVSIPLMLYLPSLNINKKHLNIVPQWIEGYYAKDWKTRSEEWGKEWRQLHLDLKDYAFFNSFWEDDDSDWSEMKILESFWIRARGMLEEQNIEVTEYDDFDSRHIFGLGYLTKFKTQYLDVEVSDLNRWHEDNYKKYSSGYIKEEYCP